MTQCEVEASSIRGLPETVRVSPSVAGWEPPTPSPRRDDNSTVHGSDPSHSPKVVQLSRNSADEEEELFLRRQSSTSSVTSDKMRSNNGALPSPGKRSALEQPNHDPSTVGTLQETPAALIMHSDHSSDFHRPGQPSGHVTLLSSLDAAQGCSERLPSGYLYPCANLRESPNSCLLNAAHFTFNTSTLASPDLGGSTGSNNNNTTNLTVERIFKKLMRHRSGGSKSSWDDSSSKSSPVSTLDCPKSPPTSERSFRAKSKRKSLRSRVEDANTIIAANPRPKSNLAQYLRSITASNAGDLASDDDNFEGPSEVAWLEPDSPYRDGSDRADGSYASTPGRKTWNSTWNPGWNLPLVQNPLRTVSTIVNRKHQGHQATPGRSLRKASRLGESRQDTITRISLTGSYDGSYSARWRGVVRKGTASEVSSGRSWWSEIGSGRKSTSIWTCSGRLQMEVAGEPAAAHDTTQSATNVDIDKKEAQTVKVNEAAFPFNQPIASSFVFREGSAGADCSTPNYSASHRTTTSIDVQKAAVVDVSVTESESNDSELHFDNIYHDPEDHGSIITDSSEASPHWEAIGSHSVDYVREVAVGSSGLSSRALGRLLLIERSGLEIRDGRFSVDLQRGQKLDKAPQLPRTPDVQVRVFAAEKSPKHRFILSPCLPFLQRSPVNKPGKIQQPDAPLVAPPSRRLHAMNSFTARLGPVAENPSLPSPIYAQ